MSGSSMDAPWLAEPAPGQPGEIQQVAEREVNPNVLSAGVVVVWTVWPEVGFGALVGEAPCCYAHIDLNRFVQWVDLTPWKANCQNGRTLRKIGRPIPLRTEAHRLLHHGDNCG